MTNFDRHSRDSDKERDTKHARRFFKVGTTAAACTIALHPFSMSDYAENNRHALRQLAASFFPNATERNASSLVSSLVDHDVRLTCGVTNAPGRSPELISRLRGYVPVFVFNDSLHTAGVITLSDEICGTLETINKAHHMDASDTEALVVAAHEYEHIIDINNPDEAKTQCRAIAKLPNYLQNIGIEASRAVALTEKFAAEDYAQRSTGHDTVYLNSAKCRPGGSYTIDLEQQGMEPLVYLNDNLLHFS